MSVSWDPEKYVQFGDFRDRPFFDLTARIAASSPRKVVDLGCGPGNLTASLAERWPSAQVEGVDSSAAMIEKAERFRAGSDSVPNLKFSVGMVQDWEPSEDVDVLASNAALQWVPEHRELIPRWLEALPEGAWIAFQVPGNFNAASHSLMRETAESERWKPLLNGVLRHNDAVSEPEEYLGILLDAGWQADAWETTYQQVLQGQNPVLEWVRGTGLRPVLDALDNEQRAEFESEYGRKLSEAYPQQAFGTVFPFRRIFVVGQKPQK